MAIFTDIVKVIVLTAGKNAFLPVQCTTQLANCDAGSTVPRKMDLYWFIPAFANRCVESS